MDIRGLKDCNTHFQARKVKKLRHNLELQLKEAIGSGNVDKLSDFLKNTSLGENFDLCNTSSTLFGTGGNLFQTSKPRFSKDVGIELGEHMNLAETVQFTKSKMISMILEAGPAVTADTLTMASLGGHTEIVFALLEAGAEADAFTYPGTALFAASFGGHIDIVTALITFGALVKNATLRRRFYGFSGGTSVLVIVCSLGHTKIAEFLLEHTNVHSVDQNGWTELMHASAAGVLPLVQKLLSSGAFVGAVSTISCQMYGNLFYKGTTALLAASKNGHKDVAEILLFHGANAETSDVKGNTAITEASRSAHSDLVSMLVLSSMKDYLHQKLGIPALLLGTHQSKNKRTMEHLHNTQPEKKLRLEDSMDTGSEPGAFQAPSELANMFESAETRAFIECWIQKSQMKMMVSFQEIVQYFCSLKCTTEYAEAMATRFIKSDAHILGSGCMADQFKNASEQKMNIFPCCICLEQPKSIVLLPCRHLCLCDRCSNICVDTCPVCRARIESKLCVYTC